MNEMVRPPGCCECCGADEATVYETDDQWEAVALCSACVQMLEACDYEGDR